MILNAFECTVFCIEVQFRLGIPEIIQINVDIAAVFISLDIFLSTYSLNATHFNAMRCDAVTSKCIKKKLSWIWIHDNDKKRERNLFFFFMFLLTSVYSRMVSYPLPTQQTISLELVYSCWLDAPTVSVSLLIPSTFFFFLVILFSSGDEFTSCFCFFVSNFGYLVFCFNF